MSNVSFDKKDRKYYPIYIDSGTPAGPIFAVESTEKIVKGTLLSIPGVLEALKPVMPDYTFVKSDK